MIKKKSLFIVFSLALAAEVFAQPVLQDVGDKPVFKITYELRNGTNPASNPSSYKQGEKVQIKDPTRPNYIFGGWYYGKRDKNTKYVSFDSDNRVENNLLDVYEGDVVLNAKWLWDYKLENLEKDMVTMVPRGKKVLLENFAGYPLPVNLLPYEISRYEVTQELYSRVMSKDPVNPNENKPVTQVLFVDACLFCNKLTEITMGKDECVYEIIEDGKKLEGTGSSGVYFKGKITARNDKKGWRLPNSAEWEFAARGGTCGGWDFEYAGSNNFNEVAWEQKPSGDFGLHTCGTKKPNKAGLYDMSGNASEICFYTDSESVVRGEGYYEHSVYKVKHVSRNCYVSGGGKVTGLRLCRSLIK